MKSFGYFLKFIKYLRHSRHVTNSKRNNNVFMLKELSTLDFAVKLLRIFLVAVNLRPLLQQMC